VNPHVIEIWCPKYSTSEVLIKPFNIKEGMNKIIFTRCKHESLLMEGEKIRTYKMIGHGRAGVYAVPLRDFIKEETKQLGMEI
jgi:hypothetical protein